MKKKFILFFGVGWSGTTSLWRTLDIDLNYMHSGHRKENFYLGLHFDVIKSFNSFLIMKEREQKFIKSVDNPKKEDIRNEVIFNFPCEHLLYSSDLEKTSLDHYLNYYITLSDRCGDNYEAVGDFSNPNNFINSDKELNIIKKKLEPHFDIKCIIIFRDPIRRLFSNTCSFIKKSLGIDGIEIKAIPSIADILKIEPFNETSNYTKKVKQLYNVFGKDNVCYLIMEDFFSKNNRQEVSKLEKFLDIKIPKTYPCCFVPDKGINPPKIDGLKDQWSCDIQVLTNEFYNIMRNKEEYIKVYSEFEELHGCLPANWGRPIDYGY